MNTILIIVLGFILAGSPKEQLYILEKVKSEYFEEKVYAVIFEAAKYLSLTKREINIVSIREALITDPDETALNRRLAEFKTFFISRGVLSQSATDEDIKHQITIHLAEISTQFSYATSVELATHCFTVEYVGRAKKALMAEYQKKVQCDPSADFTEELSRKLKSLDALLLNDSWKNYVIDLAALEQEPEEMPLIWRKGQGFFYRGNIYLITGFAGSMKSLYCLAVAASGLNKGVNADKTLSFYSATTDIKVLYVDTELAKNTIQKRIKTFKLMTGGELHSDRFCYLSLQSVSGDIQAKMHVLDNACRQFRPDIIILDSGRDLCLDFNDNREADPLVAHYKQLATDLGAAVISTSHKSLGAGNAKGHYGMRFNEAASLEMSLTKVTDGISTYIKVDYPKQREDQFEPFSFVFDQDAGGLVEYAPTVDHSEESRQYKAAFAAVKSILKPGQKAGFNELVRRLTSTVVGSTGKLIAERTAKNYINVLSGTMLSCDDHGKYSLVDPNAEIPFDENDDLPDG